MKSDESEVFKALVKQVVSRIYDMGGLGKKEGEVIFYRFDDPEAFLNWSVVHGFLLHGSTRKIFEDLVPYHAIDKIKESGNRKAVYITKSPAVAMFCALTGGVEGLERRHTSHMTIENERVIYDSMYFGVNKTDLVTTGGYVYILGGYQIDEEINSEFMSYKPVIPLAIIKIDRKNFPYELESYKD